VKRLFSLLAISIIFIQCAVVQTPPGGPEDKTPPDILVTSPEKNSTGIQQHSEFVVTFSELMNHDATEKAIYLSPVFWDYPTYKWSGKTLTIIPPETLKTNTTYILTVGAGATDINNNKLGKSLNLAFSTGAVIDSGSISGTVFTEDGPKTTFDIWAYRLSNLDSLEFWRDIPEYATQTDSIGGFIIDHLSAGNYFVIALDDRNGDLFWDPSAEQIALPPAIINMQSEDRIRGINLRPNHRDTTTAYISKAVPLHKQAVSIEFSQSPPRRSMLNTDSYSIRAAENDSILSTGQAYFSDGNSLVLETEPQIPERIYKVFPINMKTIWGAPFDTVGARFTGSSISDTIGPTLLTSLPANKSKSVYEDSVIELTFSERLQLRGFSENIIVTADSLDTLSFLPVWIAPNVARLRFPSRIPRERIIDVVLKPSGIFDIHKNRMPDSSISIQFRVPPADTTGEVTATVTSQNDQRGIGKLISFTRDGASYQAKFDKRGELMINSIMPGNYRFEYFVDSDSNGEWSPGIVKPFKPAEWFTILPDTLIIRSRWTTDIGSITIPESKR
jgi:hypothetical protein